MHHLLFSDKLDSVRFLILPLIECTVTHEQNKTRQETKKQNKKPRKKNLVYKHSQHHRKLRVGGGAGRLARPIF